jgi:hypothetical protein
MEPGRLVQCYRANAPRAMDFSDEAAESFANMTAATLNETFPALNSIERGATSLHDYLSQLL